MDFLKNNKGLIIALVAIAIICICMAIEPLLILLAGGVAYGIYKLYQYNKNQQANIGINDIAIERVYRIAVRIFGKLENQLLIEKPRTISDVYSTPRVVTKQSLQFVRTMVRLRPDNTQDLSQLPAIMQLIQTTLYNALACGELDDLIPYRSADGYTPILIVENVFFENRYLTVDFAIVEDKSMYDYLYRKGNNNNMSDPSSNVSKNDEDF